MRKPFLFLLLVSILALQGCASNTVQEPAVQRISPEELEKLMPKPVANLSLDDIVKLSKDGVSADEIIDKIKVSNSQYDLSPSQAVDLSKAGVDAKVLDYIHASREQALRDGFADELNKREKAKKAQEEKMRRELQMRSMPYYDPFWGYAPSPYWRYGYGPYYRPGFGMQYRWGW